VFLFTVFPCYAADEDLVRKLDMNFQDYRVWKEECHARAILSGNDLTREEKIEVYKQIKKRRKIDYSSKVEAIPISNRRIKAPFSFPQPKKIEYNTSYDGASLTYVYSPAYSPAFSWSPYLSSYSNPVYTPSFNTSPVYAPSLSRGYTGSPLNGFSINLLNRNTNRNTNANSNQMLRNLNMMKRFGK